MDSGELSAKRDKMYNMPGHLVRRLWQIHSALFALECGDLGITSVQYAAMRVLRGNPGIDATSLSELIAFDRSTMGEVLFRLEKRGLIIRTPSPTDRRVKLIELSGDGLELLEKADPAVVRVQNRLVEPLGADERKEFIRTLKFLTDYNDKLLSTETK